MSLFIHNYHINYLFFHLVSERQCTKERWARELLVDGCISYMKTYLCMCSSDMCNGGDLESIRGCVKKKFFFSNVEVSLFLNI